tara:strand:+ start:4697 stop:5893 length:1197 start_codon:yes stop_codon:yes gene_type:complete
MIKKKNISFYLVIFLFFFTFVNLLSFIAIKIITKKNIYSKDYVEFKKRFRKSDSKSTYPHPFFGFGVKQNFSSTDLLNDEPIFVNDLNFIDSNNKIKVLILGGSVAKHLSLNNSSDTIEFKKNILNNEEIFENSLNKFFNTEKFKVYNAAIDGGKQPQQLFKLYYLDLMELEFDIIINLDGFNELALPLSENYAINDHLIYPRNYSRLVSTFNSSFECLNDINTRVYNFSYIPIIEIYDLYNIRNCHFSLEGANKNSGSRFSTVTNYKKKSFTDAVKDSKKIWRISSDKIFEFSNKKNILYIHILQPNLYLDKSKKLTKKEKSLLNYKKYGDIISNYYGTLNMESLNAKNKLDLRYLFKDNATELYRDFCCHLNNLGMHLISLKIIESFREEFISYLD